VHDLAISKYVAGREKDLEFTRKLAKHGMTDKATLQVRLRETKVPDPLRTVVIGRIERDFVRRGAAKARGSRRRK
jgi:hypothetical protein